MSGSFFQQEFGSSQLAEIFEKYPNFYVDNSARCHIVCRYHTKAVYDFFVKYQDRILFGTDSHCYADKNSTVESMQETSNSQTDFLNRTWDVV